MITKNNPKLSEYRSLHKKENLLSIRFAVLKEGKFGMRVNSVSQMTLTQKTGSKVINIFLKLNWPLRYKTPQIVR